MGIRQPGWPVDHEFPWIWAHDISTPDDHPINGIVIIEGPEAIEGDGSAMLGRLIGCEETTAASLHQGG